MPNKNKKPAKKSEPKAKAKPAKAKPAKAVAGKAKTPAKAPAKPAAKTRGKSPKIVPRKGGALKASSPASAKKTGRDPHKDQGKEHAKEHGKEPKKTEVKISAAPKKAAPIPVETKSLKKEKTPKAGKKDKKKKTGKEDLDLEEDDLLASDEEMGSEEIPDLSEFDEDEVEEADLNEDSLEDSAVSADMKPADDEIVLTDAEGRRYCRVRDCDQISSVEGYCRFHYLLLWKKIQVRRKILADGKLERYVEELTSRYPDKFLEMIRKDLRTEKDFLGAIAELEIDESAGDNEFEDEAQSYVDEIRGMTPDSGLGEEEEF